MYNIIITCQHVVIFGVVTELSALGERSEKGGGGEKNGSRSEGGGGGGERLMAWL